MVILLSTIRDVVVRLVDIGGIVNNHCIHI